MSRFENDRNLLVGVLALQMGFVSQTQLVTAMQAWVLRKAQSLEEILVEQRAISADVREFLKAITERHLQLHANHIEQSLAALSSLGPIRKRLADLDEEWERTLSAVERVRSESAIEMSALTSTSTEVAGPRFRILRPHAKGGLGVVSVAEDTELHREVALKQLQDDSHDPQVRARFLLEAEVTGRLEHPGIVPVYSLGKSTDGSPFYVMRFIRGDSLRDAIEKFHSQRSDPRHADESRLELRKLIQRLIDVCNAIEYAHSRGVLHRDLKPGNIMVGKYGETLVVDWGLAKPMGRRSGEVTGEATLIPSSSDGSTDTRIGSVVGTLAYMSPEQAEGRLDSLGPASDVYCLGSTLYCMLTGKPPVAKGSHEEMLAAVRSGAIVPVRQLQRDIDPPLAAICGKAMALKSEDRYASAATLANELERWLADEPVVAYREPLWRRAGRWVRRHQTLATSTAILAAATIISLATISGLMSRKNRELQIAHKAERDSRVAAVAAQATAEKRLVIARNAAQNVVEIAESVLSQADSMRLLREKVTDDGFAVFGDLYREDPSNDSNADLFARVARISANQKTSQMKLAEAETRMRSAIDVFETLHKNSPTNDTIVLHLVESYRDSYDIFRRQDRLREARSALERARTLLTKSLNQPTAAVVEQEDAWIANREINLFTELWDLEKALAIAQSNAIRFRKFQASPRPHPDDQRYLLIALYRQGRILDFLGRTDEAMAAYDAAIAEIHQARKKLGESKFLPELVRALTWSAEARSRGNELRPLALEHITQARDLFQPLVARSNAPATNRAYWAELKKVEGQVHLVAGDVATSHAALDVSVTTLEKLITENDASYHNQTLAQTLELQSRRERTLNNVPNADKLHQQAIEHMKKASSQLPESKEVQHWLEQLRS